MECVRHIVTAGHVHHNAADVAPCSVESHTLPCCCARPQLVASPTNHLPPHTVPASRHGQHGNTLASRYTAKCVTKDKAQYCTLKAKASSLLLVLPFVHCCQELSPRLPGEMSGESAKDGAQISAKGDAGVGLIGHVGIGLIGQSVAGEYRGGIAWGEEASLGLNIT